MLLRNWRSWLLLALFFAPYLAFMGLGFLWLRERGWIWVTSASILSIACGVAFTVLVARWTRSSRQLLPPIDWDAPDTFSDFDRQAWGLVEAEATHADQLDQAALTAFQTYLDIGQRLAARLAAHYNPLSADPIERFPVIELLTALELATADLISLCRQVPGGDLVTPADWKRAVVAAGYIQKASDLYTYILPFFNPATGIPRLASQHMMVKPAWKSMQQNVLRWFLRAYVNRLGVHLIELYSGRLVIGTERYRKLTRKQSQAIAAGDSTLGEMTIAVAGVHKVGKSRLIAALEASRGDAWPSLAARLGRLGAGSEGLERLRSATLIEVDYYTTFAAESETARGRSTRKHAVRAAAESDLLVVVVDARAGSIAADEAFLRDWSSWYVAHPDLIMPPVVVALGHADGAGIGGEWAAGLDLAKGTDDRSTAIRARVQALRTSMPAAVAAVVPVAVGGDGPAHLGDDLLMALANTCQRAERNAIIRHLRLASARSKAGRLVQQVGQQGRNLWRSLRDRTPKPTAGSPS